MMPASRATDPRAGQALVEFALVVPLLLLLSLAVVEFGRAWNAHQVITDAAREATRTAVVDDGTVTQDSVVLVVRHALARAALDAAAAEVTVDGFHAGRGTPATVSIRYPHQFRWIARLLEWTGGDAVAVLKTSFSMRNE